MFGLRVFLDAYIAMIPEADGDSTPLGQRPLSVLLVVYRLWASLQAWSSAWSGLRGCCLSRFLVWVMACLQWRPGFLPVLDVEEVLSGVGGDQLHVMVADVIKSL